MPVDEDPDDTGPYARPLPPEDRLWRHPSEMRVGASRERDCCRTGQGRPWGVAVVAALLGAALGTGLVVVTGARGERVIEREVTERVAVSPVVSMPTETDRMQDVLGGATEAVVRVTVRTGGATTTGSGVLFRSDGHILTAAHLLEAATDIEVTLADGRTLPGSVVGRDDLTDVAVLKVDAESLPTVVFGTTESVTVGSPVVAVGAPTREGDEPSLNAVPSAPSVNGCNRTAPRRCRGCSRPTSACRTAPMAVRCSTCGEAWWASSATGGTGADSSGFATPVEVARKVAWDLVKHGEARHVWLGVEGADLAPDMADDLGVPGGVEVLGVLDGSPAMSAGLEVGDVITRAGGEEIASMSMLVMVLRSRQPGDTVAFGYWREDRYRTVAVELTER